jgi:hypothetical protein
LGLALALAMRVPTRRPWTQLIPWPIVMIGVNRLFCAGVWTPS